MISLSNVYKTYFLGDEKVEALKKINLDIKEGEYLGILGHSGSGKSTLMHIIGLLDRPSKGRIKLFNKKTENLSDDEISRLRNEYIGFVFQQFNLIEKFTILENVLLPTLYAKNKLKFDPQKRALELLKSCGIHERADFYPNKISGGEQQRTAIVRALMMNPKILLADEPTGNIDTKTGDEIMDLIDKLNKEMGVTIVVVTHEKHIVERTKRQIFIRDGEIVSKYL